MNVKMALKMAERSGILVKTVVANDDVASAAKGEEAKRRGVAGEILMWKTAEARAAQGGTLDIGRMLAKATFGETVKELLSFYAVGLIVLALITYVPALTMHI